MGTIPGITGNKCFALGALDNLTSNFRYLECCLICEFIAAFIESYYERDERPEDKSQENERIDPCILFEKW
jgi:hypothetical protein